eukprot:TRINITY_DN7495_c0_g1_i1.p1 TRINITY_DN7495_c0_g1~~TRINITY_DN7495_c0_g1_i1.p1  ORF type:complete len:312 (+),score=24.33 TRINITY_DN7495_c0_g1_i1:82-1017(+)
MKETEEQGPKTEPETVPDVEPEKPAPKGLGIGMAGWLSLLGLVVQNASLVMTTRYATGMRTGEAFIPAAAVVCSEVVKLFLSIILVQFTDTRGAIRAIHSELSSHFSSCFQCFVPAACYTLASSFIYYALANMEVTLFQVCTQSKVLITAGWSIVLLERKFSSSKWIALFALAIGISLCSYQGATSKKSDDSKREQRILFGLFSVFISSMSASFGGVYFEKLLKKDPRSKDVSLWMRNVFLSMFSRMCFFFFYSCFVSTFCMFTPTKQSCSELEDSFSRKVSKLTFLEGLIPLHGSLFFSRPLAEFSSQCV